MPAPHVTLTAQTATRDGLAPTFTTAAGTGHQVVNNGRVGLRVRNTNAAARTVTVLVGGTVDGLAVTGRGITVPANTGDVMTGFWPASYTHPDGMLAWTYSATDGVTVAVVEYQEVR